PDGGQLCRNGRWELPRSTEQERITTPMIREGAHYREASWEEALALVSERFKKARKADSDGALLSSLCTDEELSLFSSLFKTGLGMKRVDTFDGDILRGFVKGFGPFRKQGVRPFTAAHRILESDCILNLCAEPDDEAPVVASYIRVGALKNGAKLISVSCKGDPFKGLSDVEVKLPAACEEPDMLQGLAETVSSLRLSHDDLGKGDHALDDYRASLAKAAEKAGVSAESLEEVVTALVQAERPVLVLGSSVSVNPAIVTASTNLAIACGARFDDGIGIVPLVVSGNSLGTINTVLANDAWLGREDLDFMYVYSTGLVPEDEASLAAISSTRFVVAQSPFMIHPLVNMADVLLPAPAWFERSGHFCTIEGERRKLNVIVPPQGQVRGLASVLQDLSKDLGVKPGAPETPPCEQLFAGETLPEKARMVSLEEVSG
ncbi:MAG: molybdopterin-dependent oxidoreductase, partial [Synergistota bacterium]|nr:molybdopterin-dependent oxidoreductase [Synergistota bacterium]